MSDGKWKTLEIDIPEKAFKDLDGDSKDMSEEMTMHRVDELLDAGFDVRFSVWEGVKQVGVFQKITGEFKGKYIIEGHGATVADAFAALWYKAFTVCDLYLEKHLNGETVAQKRYR